MQSATTGRCNHRQIHKYSMRSKFTIEHECIGVWCTEGVCLYMCMYLHVSTVVQYLHMITMVDQSEDNTDGQELGSDHLDTSSSIRTPASLVSYESLKHSSAWQQ